MTDKLKVDGKQGGKKLFDIEPVEIELKKVKWGERAIIANLSQKITREASDGNVDWRDMGELLDMATTLDMEDLDNYTDTQVLAICMKIIEHRSAGIKKKSKK